MTTVRLLHLSLLLSLTSACTIDKDLLSSGSSDDGASESAEATSVPTTDAPTGGETTGTTGEPGTATTSDLDTDGTGLATTTGVGPMESELIVFPAGEAMCMPVCVVDKDPSSMVLDPVCQVFEIDVDTQSLQAVVPCDEVDSKWTIPAGHVRCFAELIDPEDRTASEIDQLSETCLATGFNVEFMIFASEFPLGVVFGAICELSENLDRDCPNL